VWTIMNYTVHTPYGQMLLKGIYYYQANTPQKHGTVSPLI